MDPLVALLQEEYDALFRLADSESYAVRLSQLYGTIQSLGIEYSPYTIGFGGEDTKVLALVCMQDYIIQLASKGIIFAHKLGTLSYQDPVNDRDCFYTRYPHYEFIGYRRGEYVNRWLPLYSAEHIAFVITMFHQIQRRAILEDLAHKKVISELAVLEFKKE